MQVGAADGQLSAMCNKVVDGQTYIASNLTEQDRREITPRVDRNGGGTAVRVAKPLVRATLADLCEAERL